jgi:alpha-glucosidase
MYGFSTQRHVNDCDRPELVPLVQEIRALLDRYSTPGRERYVVGEPLLSNAAKAARYCAPGLLHAAFNFELLDSPWSPRRMMNAIHHWEHLLGIETWPNYVLNNHDVIRSATRYHSLPANSHFYGISIGNTEDDARMKVAAAMLLTLRGTPFLYYGEEIGMRDIPIRSREEVLDPFGRRFWPLMKGRDGCRAPMQWCSAPNAGFTDAGVKPWLPVHANASRRNVEAQLAEPSSLLGFYRRLISIRRDSPALTEGMFQPVTYGTRFIMSYLRQTKDQVVLVALNFSSRRQRLVLGSHLSRAGLRLLLSTHRDTVPPMTRGSLLTLEPYEALILEIE